MFTIVEQIRSHADIDGAIKCSSLLGQRLKKNGMFSVSRNDTETDIDNQWNALRSSTI